MIILAGCHRVPNGSSIDRNAALKTSDAFVSALKRTEYDHALELMQPEAIEVVGRSKAKEIINSLLHRCTDVEQIELISDDVGNIVYVDGRVKPERRFFYGSKRAQSPDACRYIIEVVPTPNGMEIAKFDSVPRSR
jgi:hypothetical protein